MQEAVGEALQGPALVAAFEERVEKNLIQPTFITQFPLEVSPLSRRNEKQPEYVDRFELFIVGKELPNAFSELNDPDDQRGRFAAQAHQKARRHAAALTYDRASRRPLTHGIPSPR